MLFWLSVILGGLYVVSKAETAPASPDPVSPVAPTLGGGSAPPSSVLGPGYSGIQPGASGVLDANAGETSPYSYDGTQLTYTGMRNSQGYPVVTDGNDNYVATPNIGYYGGYTYTIIKWSDNP